jgi:hypothetical protein
MKEEEVRKVFEKIVPPSVGQRVIVNKIVSENEMELMRGTVGHYPFDGTIIKVEDTSPLLFRVEVVTKRSGLIDFLFWRREFEVLENEQRNTKEVL